MRQARLVETGLVVLGDAADATTSGAPGDSTWVLRELLKYDWPRGAAVTIVAPEVVEQAAAIGPGSTIYDRDRRPARSRGFPRRWRSRPASSELFDARFVLSGHLGRNLAIDMGAAAAEDGRRAGGGHLAERAALCPRVVSSPRESTRLRCTCWWPKVPAAFVRRTGPRTARIILVRAPGLRPPTSGTTSIATFRARCGRGTRSTNGSQNAC